MRFVPVEEAKSMPGLRVVLARGAWALWGECAKNIYHVKGIPFVGVEQAGFQDNPELVAWTGVRNQPQAIYEDEPVRTNWLDILNLAERIAPEPPLLPEDSAQRAQVVGLANEICGENGLGWCRRIELAAKFPFGDEASARMAREYGQSEAAAAIAELRIARIVANLAAVLHAQKRAGSRYFVGDRLTALDIYWACASNLVGPLPLDVCPLGAPLHAMFSETGATIGAALDPILFEHRDYVYREHLIYPVDFG